jgi:hypothetical protein
LIPAWLDVTPAIPLSERSMNREFPSLTPHEIEACFAKPAPPAANTFEIALVLGDTVSAGASTAGAVDTHKTGVERDA